MNNWLHNLPPTFWGTSHPPPGAAPGLDYIWPIAYSLPTWLMEAFINLAYINLACINLAHKFKNHGLRNLFFGSGQLRVFAGICFPSSIQKPEHVLGML